VDAEAALLVRGAVVPDDADAVVRTRRPERARRVGTAELRARARRVLHVALEDRDAVERFALAQRNLAERPAEAAEEVEGDQLVDDERPVALDLDGDLRSRQRERLRGGVPGERERAEDESR
jgi:hypothetical protein